MAVKQVFELDAEAEGAVKGFERVTEAANQTKEAAKQAQDAIRETARQAEREAQESARALEKVGGDAIRSVDQLTGGLVGKLTQTVKEVKKVNLGFKGMKAAIAATGIGLLLVALGEIAANWEAIVGFLGSASKESQDLLTSTTANAEAQQKALDSISEQENILKLQGKSEKEIRDLKIQQTEETIKALEAQLLAQQTIKSEQVAMAERNKTILQGILRMLTAPLAILINVVDMVGKALGKDFGLDEKFYGGIAKMVFDPEEVAKEGDKAIEETQKQLTRLRNQKAGYQLQQKADDKANAEKELAQRQALLKQLEEAEANHRNRMLDLQEKFDELVLSKQISDEEQEVNQVLDKFFALREAYKDNGEALAMIAEQEGKEISDIRQKYRDIEEEGEKNHQKQLLDLQEQFDEMVLSKQVSDEQQEVNQTLDKFFALREAYAGNAEALALIVEQEEKEIAAIRKKYRDEEKDATDKAAKDAFDARQKQKDDMFSMLTDGVNALMELNSIYDEKNEAAAKRAFENNKLLQYANTIINTASGIITALTVNPGDVLTGANYFKAASIAAAGAAQLATISRTQYQSKSGESPRTPERPTIAGGGAAANATFNLVGSSGINQIVESINAQNRRPVQAYVVGGQVTSQQELDRKRVRNATFG